MQDVFHDPATFAHGFPHDTFRALRDDDPVSHHDHPTWKRGYWVIARHADVQRVSRDSATFSNTPHPFLDAEMPEEGDAMSELLISLDPPVHTKMQIDLFFMLLQNAGSETTRNLITTGMIVLLQHPDELERLRTDPSKLAPAIEELLRWVSPVMQFTRRATKDTEIAGRSIGA